jgi:predicted SAM-dependent methyltransferase
MLTEGVLVHDMDGKVKLNLGSGSIYRPGFVNVDRYEKCVADSFSDVEELPYESQSVEVIEASQLVEHFDIIHCRYLLAEWFRVLIPGGELGLETPDLAKSFKKLVSAKKKDKESTLQWIYGIDSPGLQHKSGFTFDMLKTLLSETGFTNIRRRPSTTHTYEPGMRIECRKPDVCAEAQFMSGLRRRLRHSLGLSDSYVMIPLEAWIRKIRAEIGTLATLDRERIGKVIAISAPCNPKISICLLEECVSIGLFRKSELDNEFDVASHLVELRFHGRAFALWAKSRKVHGAEEEFGRFLARLEKEVSEVLARPDHRNEILEYLMTVEPRAIEILDLCLITQRSKMLLNLGIRRFHEGDFDSAESSLTESLSLNPDNPLAHWNLARIGIALGKRDQKIMDEYNRAAESMPDHGIRTRIRNEANRFNSHPRGAIVRTPVCEADLI